MALLPTALVLIVLTTGQLVNGQYYPGLPAYHRFGPKRQSTARTDDHAACASRCTPQPGQFAQDFADISAVVHANNATDAQLETAVRGMCRLNNSTLTCLENAAKECDVACMPLYAGHRRYSRSFCDDHQRTVHYRQLLICDDMISLDRLFEESVMELVPGSNTTLGALHRNGTDTETVLCSSAIKLREKVQTKNVEQQCGADAVPTYNSMLDKWNAAFCRTGNGAASLTFGGLVTLMALFLLNLK